MDDLKKIISGGKAWYKAHAVHVERLVSHPHASKAAIEPSGSDAIHPELWKDIHWNWFFNETKTS
jgi:hypothetical protein